MSMKLCPIAHSTKVLLEYTNLGVFINDLPCDLGLNVEVKVEPLAFFKVCDLESIGLGMVRS
jgi:hypothetical protein